MRIYRFALIHVHNFTECSHKKRIKTVPICLSACLSQWQRARQHEGRAAAGNAHCRLHMTRGSRKVWSDCKEVQRTVCVCQRRLVTGSGWISAANFTWSRRRTVPTTTCRSVRWATVN